MFEMMTRRQVCAGAAVSAAGLAYLCAFGSLSGCSQGSNEDASASGVREGFSPDTEVRDEPVSLHFLVDSDLQYFAGATPDEDSLASSLASYQAQDGRADVEISFEYVSTRELDMLADTAFEADAVIATAGLIDKALENQLLDAGAGNVSLRTFPQIFPATTHVVRAKGSTVSMPDAATIDGNDSADGTISRLQRIGQVDGMIAVADPDLEPVGISANKLLYAAGLYSEASGIGGDYIGELAGHVSVFGSQDAAMSAVANGECELGFAFTQGLDSRYPQVEDCYTPPNANNTLYEGAAVTGSANAGVARDFMQYLTMLA